MSRIIVLFSGGLDSAAALIAMMRQYPGATVHAHHCQLKTDSERFRPEWQAVCASIRHIRQNVGPVAFSTSVMDFRHIRSNFYDVWPLMLDAGQIALQARVAGLAPIMAFATGHRFDADTGAAFCPADNRPMTDVELVRWRETVQYAYRMQWFGRTPTYRDPATIPALLFPVRGRTRRQCVDDIGRDLFRLTWSCRAPVIEAFDYRECGNCVTCRAYAAAGLETAGDRKIEPDLWRYLDRTPCNDKVY